MKKRVSTSATQKPRRVIFWPRRLQRPIVETIVVDTDSLVDISEPTISLHSTEIDTAAFLTIVRKALVGASSLRMIHLSKRLEPVYEIPAAAYTRTIAGTAWHHGEHYICYWIGNVENIAQRSDLTENERERLLTTARRLGSEGKLVYAVARSTEIHTKTTDPTQFQPQNLEYLGMVTTELHPHPDLARALAVCRQQGIDVIYASTDDELVVSSVAHRTTLLPKTILPLRYHASVSLKQKSKCYAELTTGARKKLLETFDPQTTIIADQPLPAIVRTIKLR